MTTTVSSDDALIEALRKAREAAEAEPDAPKLELPTLDDSEGLTTAIGFKKSPKAE